MDHFYFTQLCRNCKDNSKTFKICLSDYDVAGRFNLSNEEVFERFSFTCEHCGFINVLDFEQLCNPNTVWYLRKDAELNSQIEEVIKNLLRIKIEKLNIPTNIL